jgi:hypothetical protein
MKTMRAVGAMALALLFPVAPVALAESDRPAPGGMHDPGEPAVPAQPEPPKKRYEDTPDAHSERPGKHSTTAGRHGTEGETGGGVDVQSGSEGAHVSPNPVLKQRQHEEGDAESGRR